MSYYLVKNFIALPHKKGDIVQPHIHDCYEVVLYLSGSGCITISSEEFEFSGKSLFIIPPNKEHSEVFYSRCDVLCCIFAIDDSSLLSANQVYIENKENISLFESIEKTLLEIKLKIEGKEDCSQEMEFLYLKLRNLITLVEEKKSGYIKAVAENARKYILNNFNKTINFEILADNLGYSYDRFRHIFTEIIGVSPKKYQMGVRMSVAKKHLANKDIKIAQIAKKCGFSSYERFSLWFHQKTGISPKQYRKGLLGSYPANVYNFID